MANDRLDPASSIRPSSPAPGADAALPTGRVWLVGAGPGDPGLLSRRGFELLRQAEVVVYDGLIAPELLALIPAGAEILYAGKHDRTRCTRQEDINELLLARARAGQRVVRLKSGDPFIFARGGEEAGCLAAAGIPCEVVPGISSAEAAAACAGIPITDRRYCSSYTVVTGHEPPGAPGCRVDWAQAARMPGTLVVLMGLKHLPAITATLIAHGRPADTPAAVIQSASTPRQRTVVGTLAGIAADAAAAGFGPPAVTVIGDVVRLRATLDVWDRRPLRGRRIVITQRPELAAPLVALLRERGAEVLEVPATRLQPAADPAPLARALASAPASDWVLFSNPHGVELFLEAFLRKHGDIRALGAARLGAFGPMTAEALQRWHLRALAVPAEHSPKLIVQSLRDHGTLAGRRVLLLRAEGAGPALPQALQAQGAIVEDVPVYAAVPETSDPAGHAARLQAEGADGMVFASGLAIEHAQARLDLPALRARFPGLRFVLTTPSIRPALERLGLCADAVSQPGDLEDLASRLGSMG